MANPPTLSLKDVFSPSQKYAAIMIDYVINLNGIKKSILKWYQPGLTLNSSGMLTTRSPSITMNAGAYISISLFYTSSHQATGFLPVWWLILSNS